MIRIVENDSIIPLRKYCADDPFGCRILAAFETYGLGESFAQFWLQIDEKGETCAAISALDSAVTICAKGEHDAEELDYFLEMLSGNTHALRKKRDGEESRGLVFRLDAPSCSDADVFLDASGEVLHAILNECGENIPRVHFCADMRARTSAGVLQTAVLFDNGKPVSCCALHIAGGAALLFAVATLPKYRSMGYAAKCISATVAKCGCDRIYTLAEPKLRGFYEKLGFSVIDEYVC